MYCIQLSSCMNAKKKYYPKTMDHRTCGRVFFALIFTFLFVSFYSYFPQMSHRSFKLVKINHKSTKCKWTDDFVITVLMKYGRQKIKWKYLHLIKSLGFSILTTVLYKPSFDTQNVHRHQLICIYMLLKMKFTLIRWNVMFVSCPTTVRVV